MWPAAQAPRKLQSSSPSSSALVPPTVSVSEVTKSGVCLLGPLNPQELPHPASCLALPAQSVVYPVRIESSSASLANGHTLDLNCLVASQAPHTITWYKRGGSLPSRHKVLSQWAERARAGCTNPDGDQEGLSAPPLCSFSHSTNTECSCCVGPGPALRVWR